MIVRWELDELEPLLVELRMEQPVPPRREPAVGRFGPTRRPPGGARSPRSHRGPRRRRRHPCRGWRWRDRHGEGRVGGVGIAARLGAHDVFWRGVDGVLQCTRPGQAHGGRRRGSTPLPASSTSRASRSSSPRPVWWHGDERARPASRRSTAAISSRRRGAGSSSSGCRGARATSATSRRARICSRAPPQRARRSRRTGSTSATR